MSFLFQEDIRAQDRYAFSAFPGYHVINTDKISDAPNFSQTNWIFGGNLAVRFDVNDIPLEYSIGYSYGTSTVHETQYFIGFDPPYSIDLRYRTLPQELFWVNSLHNRIEFLTGINVTAQDRTLQYLNFLGIDDDRLFSIGIGLSAKLHVILSKFSSDNGHIFLNLSARWTEFIYHDANDRNLDDFTLRHVALSPQLGVSFRMR